MRKSGRAAPRLTTLPTRSAFTLLTNSSRFKSRSSSAAPASTRNSAKYDGSRTPAYVAAWMMSLWTWTSSRPRRSRPVNVDFMRQVEARHFQHRRPEQCVKIRDVTADKVVDFCVRVSPPGVEFFSVPVAPLTGGRHVADRCIEPDVPVITGAVGNLESKIGGGAARRPSLATAFRETAP